MSWERVVPKLDALTAPAPAAPTLALAAPQGVWERAVSETELAEREANGGYTARELVRMRSRPDLMARLHLKVPDRVTFAPIAPLPTALQRRMYRQYVYCQEHENPCREVVVKIRRGGGSAGGEIIAYCHLHNHVARFGVIGTTETASMNMFKLARFLDEHDDFPGWQRRRNLLETGKITWPNGSEWEKYTADNPEAARSAGLAGYHATEVGRWQNGGAKDAKETLRSMLGAVPRRGFTLVIEESTARGAQGVFYERFKGGRWPTAEELGVPGGLEYWRKWEAEFPQNLAESEAERRLQFVRVFAAWFEDDENRPELGVSVADRLKIQATLSEKEQALISRYRTIGPQGERLGTEAKVATLWEQLAWRRSVLYGQEFDGDEEFFEQENPSSPMEAFASSGRHTFNRAGCAWMMSVARSRPAPEFGVITKQSTGGVDFKRTPLAEAWFYRWEGPREGMRYLASLDTCGGRSNVRNLETCDYNAGLVIRAAYRDEHGVKHPHRVVGTLMPRCLYDPDVLAEKMALISEYYGRCLVVFEVNNTGAAFREHAKQLGMNLYLQVNTEKATSQQTTIIGWTTTRESRQQLISMAKMHIRNNAAAHTRPDGVECYSVVVCEEVSDMIFDDDEVDRAPGNKHDDHAIALGIGLATIGQATMYTAWRRRSRGPSDGWAPVS